MPIRDARTLADPFAAWRPSEREPWNLERVVHLHRRTGFGATWDEAARDLADDPDHAIERVLTGCARFPLVLTTSDAAEPGDAFERLSSSLANAAVAGQDSARLEAWWLHRMLLGVDPLAERLALMWHNHFATSNLKLNDLAKMQRQNELFRRLGRAPFGELLRAVLNDPAVLLWLDAPANRKEHPNENLGREVMELFTLGVGHYDERDVKEAARALTGWTVTARGAFREEAEHHDDGEKTLFGRTGRWRGDDLIAFLLEQPACAERLAFRLCELLFAEGVAGPAEQASLVGQLRASGLDIGAAVATIVRSRLFFSDANLGLRILSPAEFIVGAARALDCIDPPPSTLLLAEWCTRAGQQLFQPPTVFGWEGGRAWISTASVLVRSRFAGLLCDGALATERGVPPPLQWMRNHRVEDPALVRERLAALLLGGGTQGGARRRELLADDGAALPAQLTRWLSSPLAQLG